MTIGLKRGTVELADHDPEWEKIAAETIERLWHIFGDAAKDIQHVGSTTIRGIKAKPIIDIAILVDDFDAVTALILAIEQEGFKYRADINDEWQRYIVLNGSESDIRISNIHVVKNDRWCDYLNFRDYLNVNPCIAKEYEDIKVRLAAENLIDPGREKYLAGKHDFVAAKTDEARIWAEFGKRFVKIEPITKGMSGNKKYRVETTDDERFLLRIADISEYDRKKTEYDRLKIMDDIGIPMSRPIDFGICNNEKSVYQLLTWCDGVNLENALSLLSETEQYVIGLKAGEILRKIHAIPVLAAESVSDSWNKRYGGFIDESIKSFHESGVQANSSELLLKYFTNNRHLLNTRPSCCLHGDYHTGNMMYHDKSISVIDWEIHLFDCFGDPWWEVLYYYISPHYSSGVVHGYFGGEPPVEFWEIYSVYAAVSAISSISWAYYRCPSELDAKIKNCSDVVTWFDIMKNPVPSWYRGDFYIQWIDGVPYKLKSPFDFSFLGKYGKVFKVFDDQDSGNICFGVQAESGKRYFVKFAGAPTARGTITAKETIANLKQATPIYRDLAHANLIQLIDAEDIGAGYAVVFEWVHAICTQRMYPADYAAFRALSLETKHQIFTDIMEFHAHITVKGYVAIDFYDGSIMWDDQNQRTIICDIDFYQKSPYIGRMGLWGSSRFVSPEERTDGAVIDEVTTVYTMGATAFCLFADSDRSLEKWSLSPELYAVVKKAVSDGRSERQQSIRQLIDEWRTNK